MSVSYTIEKVCMQVQIEGKLYVVCLPQDRLLLLTQFAASLSEDGKLPVRGLSEEYKLEEIKND